MKFSPSTKGFYLEAIHGANIPEDAVSITAAEHSALLEGQSQGKTIAADVDGRPYLADPAPTQAQIISRYESALDAHLDAVAQKYRYRDRVTFAMRAGYAGPWQADGAAFGTWMDTCNAQAYSRLQDILSGAAEMPTVEEFIAELPPFVLP